jgi:hypothetical protein
MTIKNLQTLRNPDYSNNTEIIQLWDKIVNSPTVKNNIKAIEIDQATANSYAGNFFGLLSNELGIDSEMWIPTCIINNTSGVTYNGFRKINLIEPNTAEYILTMLEDLLKKRKK